MARFPVWLCVSLQLCVSTYGCVCACLKVAKRTRTKTDSWHMCIHSWLGEQTTSEREPWLEIEIKFNGTITTATRTAKEMSCNNKVVVGISLSIFYQA